MYIITFFSKTEIIPIMNKFTCIINYNDYKFFLSFFLSLVGWLVGWLVLGSYFVIGHFVLIPINSKS